MTYSGKNVQRSTTTRCNLSRPSYPLHPSSESSSEHTCDVLASHENPSGGQLILGHTSLLTTFLLTADEQYIVTADRDEHIRVSWYPQGYTIESYCLGHEKSDSLLSLSAEMLIRHVPDMFLHFIFLRFLQEPSSLVVGIPY